MTESTPVSRLATSFWAHGLFASLLVHSALAGGVWLGVSVWRGENAEFAVGKQGGGGMAAELSGGSPDGAASVDDLTSELHGEVTVQPGTAIIEAHRYIEEPVGLPDLTTVSEPDPPATKDDSAIELTRPIAESVAENFHGVAASAQRGSMAQKTAEQSNPGFVQNAPPIYPPEGVPLRKRGRVTVRLFISEEGQVTAVEILESSGYAPFDRSAVDAVKKWRSQPIYRDGKPVPRTVIVPFNFEP